MKARWIALVLLGLAVLAGASMPAGPAAAQPRQITVEVSSGRLISFPRPARGVFIADPTIADVQVPSNKSVIVFGRKPGRTTLIALDDQDQQLASIQVVVRYELTDLQQLVRQEVPNGNIEVLNTPSGIVLSGTVPDPDDAEKAKSVAQRFIGEKEEIVNRLKISTSMQVNLRLRVAEVGRTVTKQLGINWNTAISTGNMTFGLFTGRTPLTSTVINPVTGGETTTLTRATPLAGASTPNSSTFNFTTNRYAVSSVIDALAEEGLITVLAEPNLTAISGETASFLAGGEFPVPVSQTAATSGTLIPTITIQFKPFGVSLDFVPTVLSSDRISLKVRPEVSDLSDRGAITTGGLTIPALSVRRAETTVELGSGESFAIAGLIQNNQNNDISKYPGLGDIPILGTLFRSTRFQRNETELVIIVTPYVVRPVGSTKALRAPTDGLEPASDLERIFLDRLTKTSRPDAATAIGVGGTRLQGQAGFMFE